LRYFHCIPGALLKKEKEFFLPGKKRKLDQPFTSFLALRIADFILDNEDLKSKGAAEEW
jgi:hypothetical protein